MKQVLCLLYHRISSLNQDIFNIAISPSIFEEQMACLSKKYNIIRFEDDWNSAVDGKNIVITFDDGYYDNYEVALPILKKYQVPATFFISTGYIGKSEEFWWDKLITLLTVKKQYPEQYHLKNELYDYIWQTDSVEKRLNMIKSMHTLLRLETYQIHSKWLGEIEKWADISYDEISNISLKNRSLSVEELQKMAQESLVTIGGHTVHHASLGGLSLQEQEKEIKESIDTLSTILKKNIEVFSYPFGGKCDYTQDTYSILKKYGVKKAATTESRQYNSMLDYKYEIPRWTVNSIDTENFERNIEELFKEQ